LLINNLGKKIFYIKGKKKIFKNGNFIDLTDYSIQKNIESNKNSSNIPLIMKYDLINLISLFIKLKININILIFTLL